MTKVIFIGTSYCPENGVQQAKLASSEYYDLQSPSDRLISNDQLIGLTD